jgi:YVTN family beta-propeller protein
MSRPRASRAISALATMALVFQLVAGCGPEPGAPWVVTTPADSASTAVVPGGTSVIPNGRLLTPRGRQIVVAPHPYGLTLSRDGSLAVTANSGIRPFSISILREPLGAGTQVTQIPPGAETDEGILAAVFMGLAVSPDDQLVYVGGGQEGAVVIFDLETGERMGEVDCNVALGGKDYRASYIGDLVLTRDGGTLYAVDQTNFRLVVVDTRQRRLVGSVAVGRYPFGVTLTPSEDRVYVANVGMFEYAMISGMDSSDTLRWGLPYPPFGAGSPEAREGVEREGFQVPGLGDPNVPESFSVWGVDVSNPTDPRVVARVKTGYLVGETVEDFPTVGGSSPNSLVSTDERVFVSNGNNDIISVIDTRGDSVVAEIPLVPDPRLDGLRGVIPFGLAISPDGRRLYVAEAGINAVGVVDVESLEVLGHLPVGWFPSKLAVSPDGRQLIVANAKGYGSGPNGGPDFHPGPEGEYVGNLMKGVVSVVEIPPDDALASETEQVVRNNFRFRRADDPAFASRGDNPIPLYPGASESPIKHLVLITKENRTFDEIFGQKEWVLGEPSLARFGEDRTVVSRDGTRRAEGVTVMPNHQALAEAFGVADNFYCDSDVSADGHRWLVGVYPNEWTETGVAASYGGGRRLRLPPEAPGVLGFVGSSASTYPEDYNEAGSLWDHLERGGVEFFNFGLGLEFAGGTELGQYRDTGIRLTINYPMPGPLWERTSRGYPTFNMAIPDQFRADRFIQEFRDRWLGEGETMPPVVTLMIPQDHGAGERPAAGYPFLESYMADNDLALGRIVEFLSHTPYWESMAIVVTEDDPQGGVDHVDAHRSLLMVISPWARRGYVSKVHHAFGSIMKTFWHVLGLPYLNQYDAGATDLADFFTSEPDFSPYDPVPVDSRIFDAGGAPMPGDEAFDWEAVDESPELDDPADMQRRMREERAGRGTPGT